jgi:single-stranded DNA-binding protein
VSGSSQILNKPDLTVITTNDTNISNYVLTTSNYLVNYNNLINKPDLTIIATNNTNISNYVLATSNYFVQNGGATQINSDWNSVSGFSQILNKPDLTVIATNNTNLSNYVLTTSNYLVNYNNLINKPDLTVITTNNTNLSNYVLATSNYFVLNGGGGATQVNSDWNSVSGFSQILNKPDLTVIATNNTNLSNYVLATSNYFVLNGGGGGSTSTYWTLAGTTNAYFNLAGNVGIGTTNPVQKLHVVGDIASTGKVTSYYSDERLKTNISNISNSLDIINNIKGFYYEPNEIAISLGIKNRGREVGLSAQDVNRMVPEVVSLAPIDIHRDLHNNLVSKSGSNYLTVNYERLIPILVESIKELNIQITQLKLENAEFRKDNAEFRAFKDRISKYYE